MLGLSRVNILLLRSGFDSFDFFLGKQQILISGSFRSKILFLKVICIIGSVGTIYVLCLYKEFIWLYVPRVRGWETNTYESSDNWYPKRHRISPRPRNFLHSHDVENHCLNVLFSPMCKKITFYTENSTWKVVSLTYFFTHEKSPQIQSTFSIIISV